MVKDKRTNRKWIYFFLIGISLASVCQATPYNIAPKARVSASSVMDEAHDASYAIDGRIRVLNQGEWASDSQETFWGQINYPWIQLDWEQTVNINRIILYDRPDRASHVAGGTLHFSDGSHMDVWEIPNDGSPKEVTFESKNVKWVRFEVTDAEGTNVGLSEIEVFPSPNDYTDYVSWVNPYVETARGRYFYFVTGNQPYGMIGAAPLTRNKNQYGGGYNYNSLEVLGFPQIHCWMLSGLVVMPVTGNVNPSLGEEGWKSPFLHTGEIVQPGYHRLFLEKYKIDVEQTATDRVGFYRLTYTEGGTADVLLSLGGYVGTSTMVNAHVYKKDNQRVEGYFDTTGRLWGGPDVVRIYFAVSFDTPFLSLDGWNEQTVTENVDAWTGKKECTPRNAGMSYYDAPTTGVKAHYRVKPGTQIQVKTAISYVSTKNAWENMQTECAHWDFDKTRRESQQEWNEWLGRIDVKGGGYPQKIKFYTDLWHCLLGRHKLDDCNGEYPDYTDGTIGDYKKTVDIKFHARQVKKDSRGQSKYHMYNSDAFWLTQWNLNTLWGLAYPDVLDDIAASLLQYDANGGLIPRGPCAGGYSYIMSGCPGTSLITSAYQRGALKKWDARKALKAMARNHDKGGMLAWKQYNDLDFYIKNGYCPKNAGLTIQWAFEDWALGEMAFALGEKRLSDYFHKRSAGWPASFHKELKLILPKDAEGNWVHQEPLKPTGYVEANAWQATFGLSHDIPRLAALMGGNDSLCQKLDFAFRQAESSDFVSRYGDGYVSYANQPGCSNAHVFAHAGKPWLTQYWVRRVKEQAYGDITPNKGYGGHDEDQGQMGGISALMAIGLFSLDGGSSNTPCYDITSPVFDEVTISLNTDYYAGKTFKIKVYGNSDKHCYIRHARLNGKDYDSFQLSHEDFSKGGLLELWMDASPNKDWGNGDNRQ